MTSGGAVEADRLRVLIVDDQPATVRVLAEALGRRYEILFATSGARALEIAGRGDVDLVLLDVMLPDLDGFEVCRQLKSDDLTKDLPVIFVTAKEEVADETKGFDVGGVDYITKPISPPIVRARVRTHLDLKAARDLLEKLASFDGLTGIANRRRFDDGLDQEWQRAARRDARLALVLFDVDHFKAYNDRYGHAKGDECLRQVAVTLEGAMRRPGDLVARYGGEEFVAVLPDTDLSGLDRLLGRALGEVRALALPHEGSSCARVVTVSAGAAVLRPQLGALPAVAVEAADRLLYEAKEEGRNRGVLLDLDDGEKRRIGA